IQVTYGNGAFKKHLSIPPPPPPPASRRHPPSNHVIHPVVLGRRVRETRLVKRRKCFQVVNDVIINATEREHAPLLVTFCHRLCA
ncbi:hypothetical protein JOB18_017199, partial [Solea senegalensis]